jgi:cellulose synthase/poly-beta-1,6-N-acetylglucosamine synthase-like glycosyltransferase
MGESFSMSLLFWICLFLVGYTYAGYPALLSVLVAWKSRREALRQSREKARQKSKAKPPAPAVVAPPGAAAAAGPAGPSVSIVVVVHNESARLAARIENLAQCEFPGDRELIVVCGGCTDDSAAVAASFGNLLPIRVIELPENRGKATGLNAGVAGARGDLIVFADARQRFHRHAIRRLTAAFADPAVGAVSGNLDIAASETGAGAGIDAYWKLERLIRHLESEFDSAIGCTGAIYAIRRSAFEPLPEDTILDDVVIPMRILVGGARVLFDREATAFDPQELAPDNEQRRKIRTLAGNYQMLFRYPAWLAPWKNRAWWQVISHKYLRLAGPFLLPGCLISSILLARDSGFFRVMLTGQLFCYALALLGLVFRAVRSPVLTAPAGFLFLQWQGLRALFHYLRIRRSARGGVW